MTFGTSTQKARLDALLSLAGVRINGGERWDMQVHDDRVYAQVMGRASLGLGEAYMNGWWDVDDLDEFFTRVLAIKLETKVGTRIRLLIGALQARLLSRQSRSDSIANSAAHYDIGNDLYRAMLDRRLTYTCGYWRDADDLDAAQEAKLDLICRKLSLKPGERVLDIGCGWGSFLKFAAERYGAHGVGISLSPEQIALGREQCAGLPIELRLQDYRDLDETFDHIVSLGMFEHVGWRNHGVYMQTVHRSLSDDGLFLLHAVGGNESVHKLDAWMERYIFPGALIPSIAQIGKAIEGRFVMEDWHNFGVDYDRTLMAWDDNFTTAWPSLRDRYDERFYRMWRYYLHSCAGSFRSRSLQLWQVVLSKKGVAGGYRRPEDVRRDVVMNGVGREEMSAVM